MSDKVEIIMIINGQEHTRNVDPSRAFSECFRDVFPLYTRNLEVRNADGVLHEHWRPTNVLLELNRGDNRFFISPQIGHSG